ncbi:MULTISPECIES: aldose 1-epimerase [unclassified Roseitalea]|uniref:aldose 1-epimerase n=1 Tax=unclassified Roseitalea TaxID=2639107 RepID=UPI00273F8A1A|nr:MULTISPECIES: aldose 1-epimerase [unclassified Roseitalea]
MDTVELAAGEARLSVVPSMGAGIADLSLTGADGRSRPVLRPWSGRIEDGPFALACNLLVPFSNRIEGGFSFGGARHDLEPNLAGEPFAIHGDGFQRRWAVAERSRTATTLVLEDGAFGPLRYRAEITYALSADALLATLTMTSAAEAPLPFGLGFHPWFPRSAGTRLLFEADEVWLEDDRHLPTEKVPVNERGDWAFSAGAALPDGLINNAFAGWRGPAHVTQASEAVPCTVTASDNLDVAIVYSPGAEADFFCFEPVSHPVDAHNMDGLPGLAVLAPGEDLSGWMKIAWG